jgi:hypothetical protein
VVLLAVRSGRARRGVLAAGFFRHVDCYVFASLAEKLQLPKYVPQISSSSSVTV